MPTHLGFEEVVPPLSRQEAQDEALRCYYCYDAPCMAHCPTGINIPEFIRHIAEGHLQGAARVIFDANILGSTCARICPTEVLCEGACVRTKDSRAVSIGRLQRVATDYAMTEGFPSLPAKSIKAHADVGIVGAGPAALGAAAELRRYGCTVTVYEAREQAGGLDTYGIVEFREPLAVSKWEVQQVEALGVQFHYGVKVGQDVSWEEVKSRHDVLIIAVGLGPVPPLGIPGEQLKGVYNALELIALTKMGEDQTVDLGDRVVVIGAGNTAVDAATCAKRLGALEVTILYRRGEDAMPAYAYEYAFAKLEGVNYKWWTVVTSILGDTRVQGVHCRQSALAETNTPGESLRHQPLVVKENSDFEIACDSVIIATGQSRLRSPWAALGIQQKEDVPMVDPLTFETSRPRVYAVGDCLAPSEATVVSAVQQGKQAAWDIVKRYAKGESA